MRQRILLFFIGSALCIANTLSAQKCIDLGTGIGIENNEFALIDYFKNNQDWEVQDANEKEWYACADTNEFKIVNGAYYNYDSDWSCDVNNDAWNEPWDDTYISYWDMMVDQGRIRGDGYPKQFPDTIYRYKFKSEDPQQGLDSTQMIPLTSFTRRMYFPKGLPTSGWVMKWKGTGRLHFQGLENAVGDAGTTVTQEWESWTPDGSFAGYNYMFESSGAGRLETDLHWMIHGWVLEIQESDPNDPIRDVVFLFPGLESEYDGGEIFNPMFVERMQQFNALRYTGYLNSNNIESRDIVPECHPYRYSHMLKYMEWDERTPENWYNIDNGNGGNYEYIIALANKTKTDPWVNIPYCASPDYAEKLVDLFMERLDPDLTLYLEVGNEMWNFASGFSGFRWQAALRVVEYPGLGDVEARGAHINKIFKRVTEVAGEKNLPRIQRVYAGFPRYTDINNRTLNYIDKKYWDALATTWYFSLTQNADGNGCTEAETGLNWRSVLYNWWQDNPNDQQGFNEMYRHCLLQEFRCSGGYTNNSDVVLAKYYGKYTICYEGGNHTFYGCENGPTGGELEGELDFDSPTYPDYRTDNAFINAVAVADESNELAEVYDEIIDSLQSAGIRLANHLSFAGNSSCYGVWSFIQPRDMMDPLDELLNKYGKFRVFSERIQNNNCTQLEIILEEDTIGPGLSVLFDGVDDYIETNLTSLPSAQNNYAVETWVKPTFADTDLPIFYMANTDESAYSHLYIRNDNKLVWNIQNGTTSEVALVGSEMNLNEWAHIAITKNGNRHTLYKNGVVVASINATVSESTYDQAYIAHASATDNQYFGGKIDEIRIWNTNRTREQIREYMCKKLQADSFENILAYYRLDSPDYTNQTLLNTKDTTSLALLQNVNFTKRSRFAVSGAPLGDYSKYIYPQNWEDIALNINHSNGDGLAVSNISGNTSGAHVYIIDGEPYYNDTLEYYEGNAANRVYGVFLADGSETNYDLQYNYAGNPLALDGEAEKNQRLLGRKTYATEQWKHTGAKLNTVQNSLFVGCKEMHRGEYMFAFRKAENPLRPGSGMALRNAQVPTGNIQGQALYLDIEDYTVSFWAKGWGEVFNLTGKYHASEQKFTISSAYDNGLNCGIRTSFNWGETQYVSPGNRIAQYHEWKHYAITRKGSKITIYINGIPVASNNILHSYKIEELYLFNDPEWQTGNYIDGHADLTIDEFQLWDIALDQETIRDWMCKKVTSAHPYECENLVLYFNFDEGTGTVLEDTRGPSDIVLTTDGAGFEWVASGAAIGNESMHDYTTPNDITMVHSQGDSLTAERTSGNSSGVHLYRIDNMPPIPSTVNDASILSMDSSRYWGMYVVDVYNSENAYTITNSFGNNQQVNLGENASVRLLSRFDNASMEWSANIDSLPNTNANTISLQNQDRGEYVLGGTSATTFEPYEAPAAPIFISDNNYNDIQICGNSEALKYKVENDPLVENYIWILPQGFSGFSNYDSITIQALYNNETTLTDSIGIAAVNSYGVSDTAWFSIEILAPPTIADAGPDITIIPPTASEILDGNTANASYTTNWTVLQGTAQFVDETLPNTEASAFSIGENVLQWSISNGVCPASIDSMVVTYAPAPSEIILTNGTDLLAQYCSGDTITIKVLPQEGITPDSYTLTLPDGMEQVLVNKDEFTIAINSGFGGTIEARAVYAGIESNTIESSAIGISESPSIPVFVEAPSVLCLNVNDEVSIQQSATIDSVVWTLPYGIYPVDYPKSTSPNIEIQGIFMVNGFISAQAYYNGCTSTEAIDSFYTEVNAAPDKPMLHLGTDGGTADPMCRNDDLLLWVDNNDPSVMYEWTWQSAVAFKKYFGDNKHAGLFTVPRGNSEVRVRAITSAEQCNTSEWFVFNGWVWDETPSEVTTLEITDPAGQITDELVVGNQYTFSLTGTGDEYYWDLPQGFSLIDDGNTTDTENIIEVTAESAGVLDVYPITLRGCAGAPASQNLAVTGTILPPEYVSGDTEICENTNLNIQITDVGATQYRWLLPNGTEFTTTTPVLDELIVEPMSGSMQVFASNGTYESTPLELHIQVNAVTIPKTGFIDADNNYISELEVCTGDRARPIYYKNTFAESYIWDIEGSAIQFEPRYEPGHDEDNQYELNNRTSPIDTMMPISWVDWRSRNDGTDGGYIYVTAVNGCGGDDYKDSIYYYWAIPMSVQIPEFTNAPNSLCVGSTVNYEVQEIPYAQQYIWKMPSGLLVDSNVTDIPTITASVVNGQGGNVEVYAVSDVCGLSNTAIQYSEPVSIEGEPVDFHFVQAPASGCEGQDITFEVNDIGADTYTWLPPAGLSSTIIDNSEATFIGNWETRDRANMIQGSVRRISNNNADNRATYTYSVDRDGTYEISLSYYTNWDNRADVPVWITHAEGTTQLFVNMQNEPENGIWHSLGKFQLTAGNNAIVAIGSNASGGGVSVADAVKFESAGIENGTSYTATVQNDGLGALCVAVNLQNCESKYTICTDPIILNGTLPDPEFTQQPTEVCTGFTYTYAVNNIGADSYRWILPTGVEFDGISGEISIGREITVTFTENAIPPVQLQVRGINSECGSESATAISSEITVDNSCKLETPQFVSGADSIEASTESEINIQTYTLTTVDNAESYMWTIPDGLQQAETNATGTVETSEPRISLIALNTPAGETNVLKVVAHSSVINDSDTAQTEFAIRVVEKQEDYFRIQLVEGHDTICEGDTAYLNINIINVEDGFYFIIYTNGKDTLSQRVLSLDDMANTIAVTDSGTYRIVQFTNATGQELKILPGEKTITVLEMPPFEITQSVDPCDTSATFEITNPIEGNEYVWNTPEGTVQTSKNGENAKISFPNYTSQMVNLYEIANIGCARLDTNINVPLLLPAYISNSIDTSIIANNNFAIPLQSNILNLEVTGNLIGNDGYTYRNDSLIFPIADTSEGTYQCVVTYNDANMGCAFVDQSYTIEIFPVSEITIQLTGPDTVCTNIGIEYSLESNDVLDSYTVSYISSSAGAIQEFTDNSVTIIFTELGNQTITARVTDEKDALIAQASISVYVQSPPTITISGRDTVCKAHEATYTVSQPSGFSTTSRWTFNNEVTEGSNEQTFYFDYQGDISLLAEKFNEDSTCVAHGEKQIVSTEIQTDLVVEDLSYEHCFSSEPILSLELTPIVAGIYYIDNEDVQFEGMQTIQYEITDYGTYGISVEKYNCSISDSIRVTANCESSFAVPEAFTPNNDGKNDKLQIFGSEIENLHFIVVNRWGELVFESSSVEDLWDGTYNNEDAMDGTYSWQATYSNSQGQEVEKKGKVVLMR